MLRCDWKVPIWLLYFWRPPFCSRYHQNQCNVQVKFSEEKLMLNMSYLIWYKRHAERISPSPSFKDFPQKFPVWCISHKLMLHKCHILLQNWEFKEKVSNLTDTNSLLTSHHFILKLYFFKVIDILKIWFYATWPTV